MIKRGFLCGLFSFLFCFCYAQRGKDFLLTKQRDTLFGKITMDMGKAPITFVHQKQKITFHPTTIQSFGVFNGEAYQIYETLSSEKGQAIFVEVVAKGKANLYKYVEKRIATNSTQDRYVYFFGTSKEELTVISSSNYRRILGAFLSGHPSLIEQLERTAFDEIPNLIQSYNDLEDSIRKKSGR